MEKTETERTYRISQAARELDLSAAWLRAGEKRGVLPPAKRDRNGFRYYTESDISTLRSMGVGSRPRRLKRAEEVLGAAR